MIKISDAIQQLWITKESFSDLYKKTVWKDLSVKSASIWDSTFLKLQDAQWKWSSTSSWSPKPKKLVVVKKWWAKVVKKTWTADKEKKNSFFSGMWFVVPKKEEVIETKKEEIVVVKKKVVEPTESSDWEDDFMTQVSKITSSRGANAEVVRRKPAPAPRQWQWQSSWWQRWGQWQQRSWWYQWRPQGGTRWPSRWWPRGGQQRSSDPRGSSTSQSWSRPAVGGKVVFGQNARRLPPKRLERERLQPSAPKVAKVSANLTKKENIEMSKALTVKEFSEKMGVAFQEVVKVMLQNGVMWWINTALDFDTVALLWESFGVTVTQEQQAMDMESLLSGDVQAVLEQDKEAPNKKLRWPIVTVMWHVDHGKTSLLDYLRKTNHAGWEAGGITQSIWASKIVYKDTTITFIDTPGHELFTTLRARGAKVTNIVIIIIAADDGIKPQTIESINHAKDAWVPVIVAVTKIDKQDNKFEQIKTDIWIHGLIPEEWGWDVPVIGVSSVTGQWIDDLLDQIALQTEMLELYYNPDIKAVWVVIDAEKDNKQGISTSMIVLTWTLSVWDIIVVHNTYGKIKRMTNWKSKVIKKAEWGEPVKILWLSEIPEPWRMVEVVEKEKEAAQKVQEIKDQEIEKQGWSSLQHFMDQMNSWEKAILKLILKADGPSSLEALVLSIGQLPLPESVDVSIIHRWIWAVTDSDISLAEAADAAIIWFNSKIMASMRKKAEQHHIVVKNFDIIYELTEYIAGVIDGMIRVELVEQTIGRLDVMGNFYKKEKTMVIGWKVISGKVENNAHFRVYRGEEELATGHITSLQREQKSMKEVAEWYECGMKVKCGKKILEWDQLEFFIFVEQRVE